jgi:hypothetical protein
LLRALVLRARELLALRLRVLLERVLLELRALVERVPVLRRVVWLVAMWWLLLLGGRVSQAVGSKVINSKDNKEYSREHAFENRIRVTSVTEAATRRWS